MSQVAGAMPLREQQRAFTRSRLIAAGRQVFAARGYPDTTVDDIAREAGASRATFYLHFKSKSELAIALYDEALPYAVSRYRALDALLVENGPRLPEQLYAWLSEWLDVWVDGAAASHALLQAGMLEQEVEAHALHLSETFIDSLEGYLGGMAKRERTAAREQALILEIMTQRIFSLASRSRLPLEGPTLLEILTRMWFEVLVERKPPGLAAANSGR
jgi:AcrR family transcriptional regulator